MTRATYSGYEVTIGRDIPNDGWYENRGPDVLKVHFRLYRVPSQKRFVLRNYETSNAAERAEAERILTQAHRLFPQWEAEGRARRRRHSSGRYYWTAACGSFLDDPLQRLEREEQIDIDEMLKELAQ